MQRTLHLVSPLMHGEDIRELQQLLVQNGVYPANVDGDYGELTAQGVFRYKHDIGFLRPDQTASGLIFKYLRGEKKPNAAMRALAAKRRKPPKKAGWREKVVQHALSQLGETERPPNSNRSKFSTWYGIIGPWCAMFVTWVFATLGFAKATFKRAVRYAYVPFIEGDARAGRNGVMRAVGPANAILALFDWPPKNGVPDHIGICAEEATIRKYAPEALRKAIARFGALGDGDFWSLEGNTGIGNNSNGGEMMLRKRNKNDVRIFVKVAT